MLTKVLYKCSRCSTSLGIMTRDQRAGIALKILRLKHEKECVPHSLMPNRISFRDLLLRLGGWAKTHRV